MLVGLLLIATLSFALFFTTVAFALIRVGDQKPILPKQVFLICFFGTVFAFSHFLFLAALVK